ncbi:MAG: hypothetical protein HY236_11510 [Acidobacteria bacterium]|nr:hypothetical protein [Acidobacteriota bacterium]
MQYAGAAPGLVAGVLQVNAKVPDGVTPGSAVPVTITVGTATSPNGVTLAVRRWPMDWENAAPGSTFLPRSRFHWLAFLRSRISIYGSPDAPGSLVTQSICSRATRSIPPRRQGASLVSRRRCLSRREWSARSSG